MKDFLYLASPYSRYPLGRDAAWKMACRVTAELIAVGVPVMSPIVHSHPVAEFGGLDPLDPEFWAKVDRPFVNAAAGLIVYEAQGWQQSEGMAAEIDMFRLFQKPIFRMRATKPLMIPMEIFEWMAQTKK